MARWAKRAVMVKSIVERIGARVWQQRRHLTRRLMQVVVTWMSMMKVTVIRTESACVVIVVGVAGDVVDVLE